MAKIIHEIDGHMTSNNNFFMDDENFCLDLCNKCYEKNIRTNCTCRYERKTLILNGIMIIGGNGERNFHEVYQMIGDM